MAHDPRLVDAIEAALEACADQDFDAWLSRWATPAGLDLGAPEPPDKHKSFTSRRAATAALDAIEAAGCVVVPVVPTERMLEAGVNAVRDFRAACEADGSNIVILDNPVALAAVSVRAALQAARPGAQP